MNSRVHETSEATLSIDKLMFEKISTYYDEETVSVEQDQSLPHIDKNANQKGGNFRAWCTSQLVEYDEKDRRFFIIASTKKRAMEMAHLSSHEFDASWQECNGDLCNRLPGEEGTWGEDVDATGGNGEYYPVLDIDETAELAELHLEEYRKMPINELNALVGKEKSFESMSSRGTLYEVNLEFSKSTEDTIIVDLRLDDKYGWWGYMLSSIEIDRSQSELFNWIGEGF